MRRASRTIDSLSRPSSPLLCSHGHRAYEPLSPLSLDLLRIAEAQGDPALWRAGILDVSYRYSVKAIRLRLKELTEGGYLTDHGTTRTGWLTPKGRRHLEAARG